MADEPTLALLPGRRSRSHGRPGTLRGQLGTLTGRAVLVGGDYPVVILDELNVAALLGAIDVADILALLDARPPGVELVITGRGADDRLIARADLVTEMVERKHYYTDGAPQRRGIEH